MLPVSIAIFMWWLPDITKLFCNKSCDIQQPEPPESMHDVLHEIISKQDIERLITAAIIMGVQKFAQTHPKAKSVFDSLLNAMKKTNTKKTK